MTVFDIECANCYQNCAKIFSLGFLITDESFNVLHEKEDVLINPRDRFDWYVAKKMMAYPKEIFKDMPPFPEFYPRFKEMFEDEDTMVIGYAVTNDVHFLHDDCKRYGLPPLTYKFYDVQQLYARQPVNNTAKNLEDSLLSWCQVEPENLHRSDEDAYNTMLIMKAIAAYHNTDLPGLMEMFPDCGGSTKDGAGFIQRLWEDANGHFGEVAHLAKKTADGQLAGVWGAMTDFSRSFRPWEDNFSSGLYLAGVECVDDAQPPEGWVKWQVPGFRYVVVSNADGRAFEEGLAWLRAQGLTLAGAVQDFTDPATGEGYMLFPTERL